MDGPPAPPSLPEALTCPACGRDVPPPGGTCEHCLALRARLARDRALYYGSCLLALVAFLARWLVGTAPGVSLWRPGLWREVAHPFVMVPVALAVVFAWRVLRGTRSLRRS